MSSDLFTLAAKDHALTPEERRAMLRAHKIASVRRGLHAAEPGTGPEGETCGTCAHLARKDMAKTYHKCGLCRARWTGGGATDVRVRDPACSKWQAKP